MPYLAVDKEEGDEHVYERLPERGYGEWMPIPFDSFYVKLPKGSIKTLIGKVLTWEDEPVELTGEKLIN